MISLSPLAAYTTTSLGCRNPCAHSLTVHPVSVAEKAALHAMGRKSLQAPPESMRKCPALQPTGETPSRPARPAAATATAHEQGNLSSSDKPRSLVLTNANLSITAGTARLRILLLNSLSRRPPMLAKTLPSSSPICNARLPSSSESGCPTPAELIQFSGKLRGQAPSPLST